MSDLSQSPVPLALFVQMLDEDLKLVRKKKTRIAELQRIKLATLFLFDSWRHYIQNSLLLPFLVRLSYKSQEKWTLINYYT